MVVIIRSPRNQLGNYLGPYISLSFVSTVDQESGGRWRVREDQIWDEYL